MLYIDPSGNSFIQAVLAPPVSMAHIMAATTAAVTVAHYAINSADINKALAILSTEAFIAASSLSSEMLGEAAQSINIVKKEVNKEIKKRRNELNKWQIVLQMPTGTQREPKTFTPPRGSKAFLIKQSGGDKMRLLGARLRSKDGVVNELIARADYHPLPTEFPGYPYTIHYHIGPNVNAGTHYVLYPTQAVV